MILLTITMLNTAQTFAKKQHLSEYEMLFYEQICRHLETTLRAIREVKKDEGVDPVERGDTQ